MVFFFFFCHKSYEYNYNKPSPISPLSISKGCSWRHSLIAWKEIITGGFQSNFLALESFIHGNSKFGSSNRKGERDLGVFTDSAL